MIRIRCDASANQDIVYIDDVVIEACGSRIVDPNGNVTLAVASEKNENEVNVSKRERAANDSQSNQKIDVNLWPNPAENLLMYDADAEIDQLEIYDSNGKKVIQLDIISGRINVSKLDSGLYFISFKLNEKTIVKNFIKS